MNDIKMVANYPMNRNEANFLRMAAIELIDYLRPPAKIDCGDLEERIRKLENALSFYPKINEH